MKILLVSETLHVGGAETFVVRMANALCTDHEVWVFNMHPELSRAELMQSLQPDVHLVNYRQQANSVVSKLDGLFYKLGIDYGIRERGVISAISELVAKEQIDVVHSHLFRADYYTAKARLRSSGFRHVSTNHGDYLLYATQKPWRVLNYESKLAGIISKLDAMVNISDDQQEQFEKFKNRFASSLKLERIMNGYAVGQSKALSRKDLGIDEESIVFGMVARGIPEKGWDILINAFQSSQLPGSRLLLVGAGPEIDRLKAVHQQDARIIFAGYSDNTAGYVQLFDIGMLPSFYKAESLPTVVIEYLCAGKPVIATDIGELRNMISVDAANMAGMLVPVEHSDAMVASVAAAMQSMFHDNSLRERLASLAPIAFGKFSMDVCTQKYVALYAGNEFSEV